MRIISSLILAFLMSGCAAYHSIPAKNYSTLEPTEVERLAFDQWGDPYPRSDNSEGLPIPPQQKNRNAAFSLHAYYRRELGEDYREKYDRKAIIKDMSDRLGKAAAGKRLVLYIVGFNTEFDTAKRNFEKFRTWSSQQDLEEDLAFAEVYWDSLYEGEGTLPAPVFYWQDSLTYSNLAGACGLRRVLSRLPEGQDVTFVTHSRGAAVALSAVSNPVFDVGINRYCLWDEEGPRLPRKLGDVRAVSFAPALGSGHVEDEEARRQIFTILDKFVIGPNENDPAVTKRFMFVNLPDTVQGDTRLGGNREYVERIDAELSEMGYADQFQIEWFGESSHSWVDYYEKYPDRARCLLWAGGVLKKPDVDCNATR